MPKKYTYRRNSFDHNYLKGSIYIENTGEELSLNKKENWKILEEPEKYAKENNCYIKIVREHNKNTYSYYESLKVMGYTNKSPPGYGGGDYIEYHTGRNFEKIDEYGNPNAETKITIMKPFKKNQYPLYREYHKKIDEPCIGCFMNGGKTWQLKGTGTKSKNKTKGMKKLNKKKMSLYLD